MTARPAEVSDAAGVAPGPNTWISIDVDAFLVQMGWGGDWLPEVRRRLRSVELMEDPWQVVIGLDGTGWTAHLADLPPEPSDVSASARPLTAPLAAETPGSGVSGHLDGRGKPSEAAGGGRA